jgi:hypothetical protein
MQYNMLIKRILVAALFATTLSAQQCDGLKRWYDDFNDEYFLGSLPRTTIIERKDMGPHTLMSTRKLENGFHIVINTQYNLGADTEHLYLLHEMCHIRTWEEAEEHGPLWEDCMYMLNEKHAFTDNLIRGYKSREY